MIEIEELAGFVGPRWWWWWPGALVGVWYDVDRTAGGRRRSGGGTPGDSDSARPSGPDVCCVDPECGDTRGPPVKLKLCFISAIMLRGGSCNKLAPSS